jgi:hypothetical protein
MHIQAIVFVVAMLVVGLAVLMRLTGWVVRAAATATDRGRVIARRSKVTIGVGLVASSVPPFLRTFDIAEWHYNASSAPWPDQSLAERVCLAVQTMGAACTTVFVIATGLLVRGRAFQETNGRLALILGLVGTIVLATWAFDFFGRPYSQASLYSMKEHWLPLGGWFLVWWCYVFRR